jgi:hypothetical protein
MRCEKTMPEPFSHGIPARSPLIVMQPCIFLKIDFGPTLNAH